MLVWYSQTYIDLYKFGYVITNYKKSDGVFPRKIFNN